MGIYRLVRKSDAQGELVENFLPDAIASYGIERGYVGSGDCSDRTELVKIVGAVSGDRVGLLRNSI